VDKKISKENKLLALLGICLVVISTGLLLFQSYNSSTRMETSVLIYDFKPGPFLPPFGYDFGYAFGLYSLFELISIPDTLLFIEHLTIVAPTELNLPDTGTIEVRYQLELRSINDTPSDKELSFIRRIESFEFPIQVSLASPSIKITQPDKLERNTRVNLEEVWIFLVKPISTGNSTYAISFNGPTVDMINEVRQKPDDSYFSYEVQDMGNLGNSSTLFQSNNVSDSSQIVRDIEILDVFGLSNTTLRILGHIGNFFGPIFTLPWILEKINSRRKHKKIQESKSGSLPLESSWSVL